MCKLSTSPFRSFLLALLLILTSALVPLILSDGAKPTRTTSNFSIRELKGPRAQAYINERVRAELETARKQGFKPVHSAVFLGEQKAPAASIDKLFRLYADNFQFSEGVVVFTVLNDGNYNTAEYQVHVYDYVNDWEIWGIQQLNLTTGATTEWNIGMYVEARQSRPVETLCAVMSPSVEGQVATWQGRSCADTGALFRGVLTRALGWAGGGFATAVVPCAGSSLGYGVCVTGAATGGFIWGIMYEGYDAGTTCRAAGRTGGPFDRADQ